MLIFLIFQETEPNKLRELILVPTVISLFSVCWALASFSKNVRLQNVHRLVFTWLGVIFQVCFNVLKKVCLFFNYFFVAPVASRYSGIEDVCFDSLCDVVRGMAVSCIGLPLDFYVSLADFAEKCLPWRANIKAKKAPAVGSHRICLYFRVC